MREHELVIPGRRSEAEASPESILLGWDYGFRAAELRSAPGMTGDRQRGLFASSRGGEVKRVW